jgi:TetR/AcrR family transcriptional repressor of nem operon
MRSSNEQKQKNRESILEAAGRLFRARGVHGVTVAEVMQAAGMTHGGFYRHFADKDDLVAHTVAELLLPDDTDAEISHIGEFAATYLTADHRDGIDCGCVFASLGSEAVRGPMTTREVMTDAIRHQIEKFKGTAPGTDERERKRAAVASWAAMIGALILARISVDADLSNEILNGTLAWLKKNPPGSSKHDETPTRSAQRAPQRVG